VLRKNTISLPGTPRTKGSKRPMLTKSGKVIAIEQNADALKAWTDEVVTAWNFSKPDRIGNTGRFITEGPVSVLITVYRARPRTHYLGDVVRQELRHARPITRVGDLDKVARAILDALTTHAFNDDSQVVDLHVHRYWDSVNRTTITVQEVEQ